MTETHKCEKCGKIIVGSQRWKAHQNYETHKKEILEKVYAYRKANPEKVKAQEQKRREKVKAEREEQRKLNQPRSDNISPRPVREIRQPQPVSSTVSPTTRTPAEPLVEPHKYVPPPPPAQAPLPEQPPLPSQAPPVETATFRVEETPEQEPLPEFQKPEPKETVHTPQHTEQATTDAFSAMFDAVGGMWNQFLTAPVTGGLERFMWTKQDSQRFSIAITLLDAKYHFGAKAAETWLPEIMLAMAIISFGIRAWQGAREKARQAAGGSGSPQSTPGTQANNNQSAAWVPPPHIQAEIDEAYKRAQDRS